jgi:hypothetical protein
MVETMGNVLFCMKSNEVYKKSFNIVMLIIANVKRIFRKSSINELGDLADTDDLIFNKFTFLLDFQDTGYLIYIKTIE